MVEFHAVRESPNKLWVETPFPISHAVWNYFVFSIFPSFDRETANKLSDRNPPAGAEHQDPEGVWHCKYLNRPCKKDSAEIADGQYGFYWKHAYLPDDERKSLNLRRWGLIYVSEQQTRYLDDITENLAKNSLGRADELRKLTSFEIDCLHDLFGAIFSSFERINSPESKIAALEKIRERFNLMSFRSAYDYLKCDSSTKGEAAHQEIHSYAPNNNLKNLIGLEFADNLRTELMKQDNLILAGANIEIKYKDYYL